MNIDFGPTLLDFAGFKSTPECRVKVLKKYAKEMELAGDAVYYHYYEYPKWHKVQPHYGIPYRAVQAHSFYYSMDEWELYDLQRDPNEMNNIYKQASPALIQQLKKKLEELKTQYKDDAPIEQMRLMTDTVIRRVYNEPSKD